MYFKLMLLCLSSILFAQNHLNDFQLKGSVKTIESTTHLISDGSKTHPSGFLDSEMYDAIKLNFDRSGNLVSRENFLDYQGKLGLFDKIIFQYNSNGAIEKQETTLIQNGEEPKKISQKRIYYYLGNELIRKDEFNSGRTTNQYWVTNFVNVGGRLKKKVFWMEDEIFSVSEFEHRLHKITSEKTIHNDRNTGQIISFEYDQNQNLITKTTKSGNEITFETFQYDADMLKEHSIKNEKNEIQLRKKFDSNQLPITIEKINYRKNELSEFKFEYEFDNQNNWIICLILENENPKFRITRKIDYY